MSVHTLCVCCLWKSEEGAAAPGTGATDSCGRWESNPGALQDQPVLLTTETVLQPLYLSFF